MDIIHFSTRTAVILAALTFANSAMDLHVHKINCIVHNQSIVQNVSCSLKPINWITSKLNIRASLTQQVDEVFAEGFLYKKAEIIYRPFLVHSKVNYCDLMKKKYANAYTRILIPIYFPYTNLNHTCPYSGDVILKDMIVNSNGLPDVWIYGSYKVDIIVSTRTEKVFTFQAFCTVSEARRVLN